MIAWRDGLETTPDGDLARQIPQHVWSSSMWITKDGNAFRVYRNPVDGSQSWVRLYPALDAHEERLGLYLPSWTSLEHAIALAWRRRLPGSRAHVRVVDSRQPPHATNVRWGHEEEVVPEPSHLQGEKWSPLRWSCGLAKCSKQYEISSFGRLRNPRGEATAGFFYKGSRWAACRGAGLVNLSAAAHLQNRTLFLAPREMRAYQALTSGLTPPQYAVAANLPETLAWTYCACAAMHVRDAQKLVARDLCAELLMMRDLRDPLLGGKLTELHAIIAPRLRRPLEYGELRFSRVAVIAD